MPIKIQSFCLQVLHSFCSNLLAFVWAVSQPRSPRLCRWGSSDNELRLPPHSKPYEDTGTHAAVPFPIPMSPRLTLFIGNGRAVLNCTAACKITSHRDKVESRNLIPLLPQGREESVLGAPPPRVSSPSEYKWQPLSHDVSYSWGRQTTGLVGKTHDLGFSPAIRYIIFNSSSVHFS